MFFFGIFFPLLWLIGAFMEPTRRADRVMSERGSTEGRTDDG